MKPAVYQELAGARRVVESGYMVDAEGRVRFSLGEYDAQHPLVIDPVLVYSTYLGGSNAELARGVGRTDVLRIPEKELRPRRLR